MATKRQKRAPGGGRKPKGPFIGNSIMVATRITPALRSRLDVAAKANSRSLSQEIQVRLTNSFDARAHQEKGDAPAQPYGRLPNADVRNHALGAMIAEIAGRIEDTQGEPWTKNEYSHAALIKAVQIFLSKLPLPIEPNTAKPSEALQKTIDSFSALDLLREPDGTAEIAASACLRYLDPPTKPPAALHDREFAYTGEYYRAVHLREALELKERE